MTESGAIRLHQILQGQVEEGSMQDSPPQGQVLDQELVYPLLQNISQQVNACIMKNSQHVVDMDGLKQYKKYCNMNKAVHKKTHCDQVETAVLVALWNKKGVTHATYAEHEKHYNKKKRVLVTEPEEVAGLIFDSDDEVEIPMGTPPPPPPEPPTPLTVTTGTITGGGGSGTTGGVGRTIPV